MRRVMRDDDPGPVPWLGQGALDPCAVLPVELLSRGRPERRRDPAGIPCLDQPVISHPGLAISSNRNAPWPGDPLSGSQSTRSPDDLSSLKIKGLSAVEHANTCDDRGFARGRDLIRVSGRQKS